MPFSVTAMFKLLLKKITFIVLFLEGGCNQVSFVEGANSYFARFFQQVLSHFDFDFHRMCLAFIRPLSFVLIRQAAGAK